MKNHFARRTLPTFESSQLCPRPYPPYPDGGGALAGGEVRLGEANKRARSAIGLTRDRLTVEARSEMSPASGGAGAMAARIGAELNNVRHR
jgi:hypothetical protein